jgi:hypothetical protein
MINAFVVALLLARPLEIPSCQKDLGGQCCLPAKKAASAIVAGRAMRVLAAAELRGESRWSDGAAKRAGAKGKIFVVADQRLDALDVRRDSTANPHATLRVVVNK